MRQITDRDLTTLARDIGTESCVLLVGPDIPVVADAEGPRSLTAELAEELAKDLEIKPPATTQLAEVAQRFEDDERFGSNDLETEVVEFFEARRDLPSDIHDGLASIGFPLVITACHDTLLEAAMQRAGRRPASAHYHFKDRTDRTRGLARGYSREQPLIYHLHGAIDEPESLVLTERDLLDFLVAVVSSKPPLPDAIRIPLQKEKPRSFLFVGFGMSRWHLPVLIRALRGPKRDVREPRSFALDAKVAAQPLTSETVTFYRRGFKVEVFDVELSEFVEKLGECVGCQPQRPSQRRRESFFGANPPRVFISYDSRNYSAAQRIFDHLLDAGCQPWLDKKRLEGGDAWSWVLEKEVDETDYFVPVLTKELAGRSEGVVFKEMNRARSRTDEFRDGIRFIIPALVDEEKDAAIPELKKWNWIDVRVDEGLDRLATAITRDWQRRQR